MIRNSLQFQTVHFKRFNRRMWTLKYIGLLFSLFLLGCTFQNEGNQKNIKSDSILDSTCTRQTKNERNKKDSVTNILKQIVRSDQKLKIYKNSYDVVVVNIAGVEFAIDNISSDGGFMLMSSIQPGSKKMKSVIKYISQYFGTPEIDEFDYLWADMYSKDGPKFSYYIKLRRIHSEEGGTTIICDQTDLKSFLTIIKNN